MSKIQEVIASNDFGNLQKIINNQYQTVLFQYNTNLEKIAYFEKIALPNALLIEKTANKQFVNGAINYLKWTISINQSITIKNNFIETVYTNNQTITELNYLLSK